MLKYSAREVVALEVPNAAAAAAVRSRVNSGLARRLAELKVLRGGSLAAVKARVGSGRTVAEGRAAKAVAALASLEEEAARATDVVFFFGASWRAAREVFVVRWTGVDAAGDDSADAAAPADERAVDAAVATVFRHLFGLLSAPELGWLTRTSNSSSYALHAAYAAALPGTAATAADAHAFSPKQAFAVLDVGVAVEGAGGGRGTASADDGVPPTVGHLYMSSVHIGCG